VSRTTARPEPKACEIIATKRKVSLLAADGLAILPLRRCHRSLQNRPVLGEPQKRDLLSEYRSAVELLKNQTKPDRMKVVSGADVETFASKTLEDMKAHIRESESAGSESANKPRRLLS
jgi:hypothetical protein